jgi:predicted  nucleic acid-binding Zn-ribbon protein
MKPSLYCLSLCAFALLSSCDSPELVQKRDKQALEIARLKGELALTEEKLKTVPADRSGDLLEIEATAKVQQEEITKLEAEIADLQTKKQAIEKEFEDYKSKYVIR